MRAAPADAPTTQGRNSMTESREDRIRARAHEIWEQAGMPLGEDMRHWEQAAREIDREDAAKRSDGAQDQGNPAGAGDGIAQPPRD